MREMEVGSPPADTDVTVGYFANLEYRKFY
jgi:hypothetical protein